MCKFRNRLNHIKNEARFVVLLYGDDKKVAVGIPNTASTKNNFIAFIFELSMITGGRGN